MYESVLYIKKYTGWFGILISTVITVRCITTLISAYFDGDFQSAWNPSKKILFAGVIGLSVSSITLSFQGYF